MTQLPDEPMLLTQKEYADRKHWSKQYVNQLVRQGRIPLIDGKIDPIAADAALAASRDPARAVRAPKMPGPSAGGGSAPSPQPQSAYAKVRTVREHYRTMREKLEYETAAGKVINREEVSTAVASAARHLRDAALNIVPQMAAELAGRFNIDEREAHTAVEGLIRKWLQSLADDLNSQALGFDARSSSPTEVQGDGHTSP